MEEVYKKIQKTLAEDFVNKAHSLFKPNFLFFKEKKTEEASQGKNVAVKVEPDGETQDHGWYKLTPGKSTIRVEIKVEHI